MRHPENDFIPARECFEYLLERARQHSGDDLAALFQLFRKYLTILGRRTMPASLQSKLSPSDLFQDLYFDFLRSFDSFHGTTVEEAVSWLRTLYNRRVSLSCRYFHDRQKRQINKEVPLDRCCAHGKEFRSREDSPMDNAINAEHHEIYRHTFEQLSLEYRFVIRLRDFDERPFAEIAALMDSNPDAVRMLHYRAMRKWAKLAGATIESLAFRSR